MTAPLVSAIIMTFRPAFVAGAIAMMRAQTYPAVEVVVGLHGLLACELPAEGRAALCLADRILELPGSQPLGTCMNIATAAARGDMIAKIDDDDLYGPRYLDEAVGHLQSGKGDVIGKTEVYVYIARERELLLWQPGASNLDQPDIRGATFVYHRTLGLNPGYQAITAMDDFYFLEDCAALGHRFFASSRRGYVLRRLAMAGHHTWLIGDDHFRRNAIVLRRNLADDSPEGLLRMVGGG